MYGFSFKYLFISLFIVSGCLLLSCGDVEENTVDACTDEVDNDGDGFIDACDQDCAQMAQFKKAHNTCHGIGNSDDNTTDDNNEDDTSEDDDTEGTDNEDTDEVPDGNDTENDEDTSDDEDDSDTEDDNQDDDPPTDDEDDETDEEDDTEDDEVDDTDEDTGEDDTEEDKDTEEETDNQEDTDQEDDSDTEDTDSEQETDEETDVEESDTEEPTEDTSNDVNLGPNQDSAVKCDTAPTIDGVLDESCWDVSTAITKRASGDSLNNTAAFDAVWDSSYLYVAVQVEDADDCVGSNTTAWWYDSVEIYVDPDNSKTACDLEAEPYHCYDAEDAQMAIKYIDDTTWQQFGDNTQNPFEYNATGSKTDDGYVIEARIPWAEIGVTPSAGMTIGFDIGINDDDEPCTGGDDSQSRDSEMRWQGDDKNYQTTANFGELVLFE